VPDPTDTKSRVRRDIQCIGCSYSLNGVARNGRCPECGLLVSASLMMLPAVLPTANQDDHRRRRAVWAAVLLGLTILWLIIAARWLL